MKTWLHFLADVYLPLPVVYYKYTDVFSLNLEGYFW